MPDRHAKLIWAALLTLVGLAFDALGSAAAITAMTSVSCSIALATPGSLPHSSVPAPTVLYRPIKAPCCAWYRPPSAKRHCPCTWCTSPTRCTCLACLRGPHGTRCPPVVRGEFGSAFFLLAQCCVIAVSSNDTFSQVACSLAGNLSVFLLWRSSATRRRRSPRRELRLVCFRAVVEGERRGVLRQCLSSSLPSARSRSQAARSRLGWLAQRCAPYLALTAAYLVVRAHVSPYSPMAQDETYGFTTPPGVLKNIGLLIFSAFLPVSV